jgi:iron complex outermembrane recepter protein
MHLSDRLTAPSVIVFMVALSLPSLATATAGTIQPDWADVKNMSIEELMDIDVTLAGQVYDPVRIAHADTQELKKLSIEELMDIDVTLTARRPERVGIAAAAISVITGDDIRRAGVTTIADAIALADGVHVARFNNGTWAISARGFNQNTANKLLVMVDGRTVYSPLFAGVFWNTLDYVLEDIARIEVIRGPGATLWGANAVNGVINIITRDARSTTGTLVGFTSGNEDPAIAEVRYGHGAGDLYWRVYGKFARRDDQKFASGTSSADPVNRGQAGFRVDGGAVNGRRWMVRGDLFHSQFGFPDRPDGEFTDANVQGRLWHLFSPSSSLEVGSYYRREYRRVPLQLTHHIDVLDTDLQHSWTGHSRHNLVWGGGLRVNSDKTHGSAVLRFDPAERTYPVASLFAQDEMTLVPDRLLVTAGLKLEHNAFSGSDWQPNVRARWMLPGQQMLWGAAARAARRPTRFDDDLVVTLPTGIVVVRGSDDFESEQLTALELGYRTGALATVVSMDATLFSHDYDKLRSQESPATAPVPIVVGNTLNGRSTGIELGVNVQPVTAWRSHLSYTYLDTEITRDADSRDVGRGLSESNDPHHLFSLRTSVDLGRTVELDAFVRHVGALPNPAVPAYTEINARIGWTPTARFEFAIVGQDIAHERHPEFGPETPQRLQFERSVRAVLTVRLP